MPVTGDHSERRLERALQHVANHWLPMQPELLLQIQQGLTSGAYDLDVSFLINDLKQDFSLFTYCVKELLPIALSNHVPFSLAHDPIKLLQWGGVPQIKAILDPERSLPDSHEFAGFESFQIDRLAETTIAATTAAALGEAKELDGDAAYCHGVVRQIGLNLIAWNYPGVYARVLRSLDSTTSLDDALSRELGFSPTLLGMRLLRPEVPPTSPYAVKIAFDWKTYDSLCVVGEALARANNPGAYPTAERDWAQAQRYIEATLGADGLQLIRRRALEHSVVYRSQLPELFTKLEAFNPEASIKGHRKGVRAKTNPYLKTCPQDLQSSVQNLYAEMPVGSVSKLAIEKLVKQIIPQAGFSGGCVYVVDPTSQRLIPRVSFGKVTLRTLLPIKMQADIGRAMGPLISEVITTHMRSAKDLALAALSCDQPLVERNEAESATAVGAICGAIGKQQKIGVLYLELPDSALNSTDPIALKIFKALRHTLCDALLVQG